MRFPIRYQLMLPLFAVAVTSLLAIGVFNARIATQQTSSRIERQLQGVVGVLADSSFPLTDAVLRQMGGLADADFVLTDAKGHQLASSRPVQVRRLLVDDSATGSKLEDVSLGPEIVLGSRRYFHSSVWVERPPVLSRPRVLHILFPQDEFNAAWRAAFLPPVLVGGVTVVALALVTHLVAARLGSAMAHLGSDVKRLAEGDFSSVTLPRWNDETGDLALAVNQTAARLADYESQVRKTERMRTVALLGAGLAHEMRNAATGCRLAIDLHAEACHSDPSDDSLAVSRQQLGLMERRLKQFLELGKEGGTVDRQEFDFSDLVNESILLVEPAARHAGIRLDWQYPEEPVTVHADPELLGQAVINLLLNALDAAAKHQAVDNRSGFVRVKLMRRDEDAKLVVTDSGEGPGLHLAETLFEPFVSEKSEGVGLGLAVAKRVVESCGGRIDWHRNAGNTEFSIRLPLAVEGVIHG